MNDDAAFGKINGLCEESLKFFGVITASVSHELNNVISIIDQTGGLLDDLLAGAENGITIPPEKLHSIVDRITLQTDRGVRIIKRLNYFSHSIDDSVKQVDVVILLENFTKLMQRLASQKKIELTFSSSTNSISIVTNPFRLEFLLYNLIKSSFVSCESERKLQIKADFSSEILHIYIEKLPDAILLEENIILKIAETINASIEYVSFAANSFFKIEMKNI